MIKASNPFSLSNASLLWIALSVGFTLFIFVLLPWIKRRKDRKLFQSVSSLKRGTPSERDLVLSLLKMGVPASTIFHDLYLPKGQRKYAQLDVVVPRAEGVIVIEVKDWSGWIYGNGRSSHWTQVLAYGNRKYRHYNPIQQNLNHISALKSRLKQFQEIPFFSIVVFYGDCELKEINYVPKGTYLVKPNRLKEVLQEIKENHEPAPYTDKREVLRFLAKAVENGDNMEIQQQHLANIKDLIGKHRIYD